VPATRVWSSACGPLSHRRWVVRADGSASSSHPQCVPRLLVCRIPCLGSVLHARTRVHPSFAARQCPAGPSAAPPALQEFLYQALHVALIAFESVPPSSLIAFELAPPSSPQRSSRPFKQRSSLLQAALIAFELAPPAASVLSVPGSAGLLLPAAVRELRCASAGWGLASGRGGRGDAGGGKGRLNFLYSCFHDWASVGWNPPLT
jgi:hypothetical protein